MSDDFVKRLRRYADVDYAVWHPWVYKEGADLIEAQTARIAELEAALRHIRDQEPDRQAWSVKVALAALEGGRRHE